jgi:hypothetical protein
MSIGHSIVAGNTVQEVGGQRYAHDIFTGSLVYFRSAGHNRIGTLDFSQILVPVGSWDWQSLSRRHYPQTGDQGVASAGDVLDLDAGVTHSGAVLSTGVDAGSPTVLHYAPRGSALDQIPARAYDVVETRGQYRVAEGGNDNFLAIVLGRLEARYGLAGLAGELTQAFEAHLAGADSDAATPGLQPYMNPAGSPILTLADTHFFGPARTWPREQSNQPYIEFWHRLDADLAARGLPGMGPEGLGDQAWRELFSSGALAENPAITVSIDTRARLTVRRESTDQLRSPRPDDRLADIGAIERP